MGCGLFGIGWYSMFSSVMGWVDRERTGALKMAFRGVRRDLMLVKEMVGR